MSLDQNKRIYYALSIIIIISALFYAVYVLMIPDYHTEYVGQVDVVYKSNKNYVVRFKVGEEITLQYDPRLIHGQYVTIVKGRSGFTEYEWVDSGRDYQLDVFPVVENNLKMSPEV